MARVPGTETPTNRAGWTPGAAVRCLRNRANADLGLADRRGFLGEVRPGHVRVVVEAGGRSQWLASEAVTQAEKGLDGDLDRLRRAFVALGGLRLESEDDLLVIFSESFPADALAEVAAIWGERLSSLEVAAAGVHELAVRLTLAD